MPALKCVISAFFTQSLSQGTKVWRRPGSDTRFTVGETEARVTLRCPPAPPVFPRRLPKAALRGARSLFLYSGRHPPSENYSCQLLPWRLVVLFHPCQAACQGAPDGPFLWETISTSRCVSVTAGTLAPNTTPLGTCSLRPRGPRSLRAQSHRGTDVAVQEVAPPSPLSGGAVSPQNGYRRARSFYFPLNSAVP